MSNGTQRFNSEWGHMGNSKTTSDKPLLLTVSDFQSETGLGRTTAYALLASGELPVVRVGRAVRIPRTALESWIEKKSNAGETNRDRR